MPRPRFVLYQNQPILCIDGDLLADFGQLEDCGLPRLQIEHSEVLGSREDAKGELPVEGDIRERVALDGDVAVVAQVEHREAARQACVKNHRALSGGGLVEFDTHWRALESNRLDAAPERWLIGADGDLAWRISDDLKWFKKNTLGKPVIMGRKTYDSIGRALPGRDNIVITPFTGSRLGQFEYIRHVGLIYLSTDLGDTAAAIASHQKALLLRQRVLTARPHNASALLATGQSHLQLGDMMRAQGDLEGAVEQYRFAGDHFMQAQPTDDASRIDKDHNAAVVQLKIGIVEAMLGRFDLAEAAMAAQYRRRAQATAATVLE